MHRPCNPLHTRSLRWSLALMVLCAAEARAYVDPGSGALLWQVVIAGLVGSLFWFRKATRWLRRRLGRHAQDETLP